MGRGPYWTDEERQRMVKMRSAGVSILDIARVLRRKPTAIQTQLERIGFRLTPEQRSEINKRAQAMANAGLVAKRRQAPRNIRQITEAFEERYCEAAERNGWPVHGYEAAA